MLQDKIDIPLVGRQTPAVFTVNVIDPAYLPLFIMDKLKVLHEANKDFQVTLFVAPAQTGPLNLELKSAFPWITFGMYGWEGASYECLAWTDEECKAHIGRALEMGYSPVFLPPCGRWDYEMAQGLVQSGVTLMHKSIQNPLTPGLKTYPGPLGLRGAVPVHTHISSSARVLPIHPAFKPEAIRSKYKSFATPIEYGIEVPSES